MSLLDKIPVQWLRYIEIGCFVAMAAIIVVEGLALWVTYNRWTAATARASEIEGKYTAFVATVKARGEEAQREAHAKDQSNKELFDAFKSQLAGRDRTIADLRKRLRTAAAPVRPDGSSVPVTGPCPGEVQGPASQRVPLEDYRDLQDRCVIDAAARAEMTQFLEGLAANGVIQWAEP